MTDTKTITINDYYVDDIGIGGCFWNFSGNVDLTTKSWAGVCDRDEEQALASINIPRGELEDAGMQVPDSRFQTSQVEVGDPPCT